MADYQADFRRILDEELGDYARLALEVLAAKLRAQGLVLTQQLLDSLRAELSAATEQSVAGMGIAFEQYGRIREMKGYSTSRGAPIEEIEKFVRKVGLGNFQYIPGYSPTSKVSPTSTQAINRIAWGIVRARVRDGAGPRPKPWFAKTFYGTINRLIDGIAGRYAAQTGQHIAASIRL